MSENKTPLIHDPVAIIGLDGFYHGIDGVDDFLQVLFTGAPVKNRGYSSNSSSSDHLDGSMLIKIIQRALGQTRLDAANLSGPPIGFFLAHADPHQDQHNLAKNLAEIKKTWGGHHSVADFTETKNPIEAMLTQAGQWLYKGKVSAVVISAWSIGGCGALILKNYQKAQDDWDLIYAVIRSIGGPTIHNQHAEPGLTPDAIAQSILLAHRQAGITCQEVGYLETFSSGPDPLDKPSISGLCQVYQGNEKSVAIGSIQSVTGNHGTASGIAAIIKTALCLYHRMIPATAGWTGLRFEDEWRGSRFYIPVEEGPWFMPDSTQARIGAINYINQNDACLHLVLTDAPRPSDPANPYLRQAPFYLFPITGLTYADVLDQIDRLRKSAENTDTLAALAVDAYASFRDHSQPACTAGIVAHHPSELLRELEMAAKGIPTAMEKNGDWQTPTGSYFTSNPQGARGKLAFVYPGAFNSYPDMGRNLFTLFPHLYSKMGLVSTDIGDKLREKMIYPRSLAPLDDEALKLMEAAIQADPIAMLITGTSLAFLFTSILQDVFSIHPAAAFGYSLGEFSMCFATGVWTSGDEASRRLESSAVFIDRLAGPQNAIREAWGLPGQLRHYRSNLWSNYVLMAAPAAVMEQVQREEKVYLTHINTPKQVVIGGDPAACQRVIAAMRCSALQAPFNYALHCDAMKSEYDGLAYLHTWPVINIPETTLYSAAAYAPAELNEKALGQGIAKALVNPLDFPKLINQVYASGARLFIEVGAGSNCTRWVDESLKDQPHASLSMNRRGADDHTSIVRLLARLVSHQVKLDLNPLYSEKIISPVIQTGVDDWQSWL